MNHFYFRIGACALLTRGRDGTGIYYVKRASRQRSCDALNICWMFCWETCPCGCYLDTYHFGEYSCRPSMPIHGMELPNISGLFQQNNAPCKLHKFFRKFLKNMAKSSRRCSAFRIPWSSIWVMCWTNKSKPWRVRAFLVALALNTILGMFQCYGWSVYVDKCA